MPGRWFPAPPWGTWLWPSAPSTRPLPSAARSSVCPHTSAGPRSPGRMRALAERRDEVEQLLVLETGKPLVDCRVEVDRTLLTLLTAAEEVARLHGETVPLDLLPSGEGLDRLLGAQADRRGRRHRRLQLPAAARRPQDRPGPRRRVPRHRQAGAADAAGDPVARPRRARGARGSRGPARRGPAGHRWRGGRRGADHRPPGRRRLLHRVGRRRAPDRPGRRTHQGAARARLQRRPRRGRGRRPRRGRRRGGARRLLRLGAGLHQRPARHRGRGGA